MTTTRTAYRIGAPSDEDSRYWEVVETAAGSVAIEVHRENQGYPEVEAIDLDASPDALLHIAAAIEHIANRRVLLDKARASADGIRARLASRNPESADG